MLAAQAAVDLRQLGASVGARRSHQQGFGAGQIARQGPKHRLARQRAEGRAGAFASGGETIVDAGHHLRGRVRLGENARDLRRVGGRIGHQTEDAGAVLEDVVAKLADGARHLRVEARLIANRRRDGLAAEPSPHAPACRQSQGGRSHRSGASTSLLAGSPFRATGGGQPVADGAGVGNPGVTLGRVRQCLLRLAQRRGVVAAQARQPCERPMGGGDSSLRGCRQRVRIGRAQLSVGQAGVQARQAGQGRGAGLFVTEPRLSQLLGVFVHATEREQPVGGEIGRAVGSERAHGRLRSVLEQSDAGQELGCQVLASAGRLGETGAQRLRFGEVLGGGLAGHISHEIGERPGPISGRGAGCRPGEARLLNVEGHRPIDPFAHENVGGIGQRATSRSGLGQLSHPRGERPQGRAVVGQRVDGGLRHLPGEGIERDRRGHESRRFGQRLLEPLAAEATRIAEVNPLFRLLIERAGVFRGSRRRGGRRRRTARGPPPRHPGPQLAEIRPPGFERQRLSQCLVGPLQLEGAAVGGEQAPEGSPGLRARRRQVDGDFQIAHRFVDAPEGFQGPSTRQAR